MIGGIFTVVIQLFILVGCMTYIVGKNGLPDMIPLILVLVTNIIVTSILLTAIGLFALVISFALLTGAMWLFFKYEIGNVALVSAENLVPSVSSKQYFKPIVFSHSGAIVSRNH